MGSINSDEKKTMSHPPHSGETPATHTPEKPPETAAEARLAMMELANMISVPMALHAFVALNIPDALRHADQDPLSAADVLRRLPGVSPTASPENLQRLLRLLASHRVVHEHFMDDGGPRRYSLTAIGWTLVSPEADGRGSGTSYAAYVLQHHQVALLRAWPRLADAVLDADADPFKLANGVSAYDHYGQNPDMNELMQRAMTGLSAPVMEAVMDGYSDGFRGVRKLVDVGGSAGTSLRLIMDRFPNVSEGVNFDLPEVVARAPTLPGKF